MTRYFWFYRFCKHDEIKNEENMKSVELKWFISLCEEISPHVAFKGDLFPIFIQLPKVTWTRCCEVQRSGYKQLWICECSLYLKNHFFNAWPDRFYLSLWMVSFSAIVTSKYMLHHLHKGIFSLWEKTLRIVFPFIQIMLPSRLGSTDDSKINSN